MKVGFAENWCKRAILGWISIRETVFQRSRHSAATSKNEDVRGLRTRVKVEWGEDMDRTAVTLGFSDGPFNEATLKGRCQRCWGALIGRRDESNAMTGIKCRVCGQILEGEDAEEEERRIFGEATTNLMNMRHGWLPQYSDGLFVRKVFPRMERLSEDEIRQRIATTVRSRGSKRPSAVLTRSNFPAGSPGWLFLQALILMAGVENASNPEKTAVVEFPDFDVQDDGSVVVHSMFEGLEEGQRHQEYRFMGKMGSTMRDSMISAFATELGMKAISLTCKDEAIKTHDLRDLFHDLPEECRGRMTADFPDIEEVLVQGRQTFGDWRYFEQALQGRGMAAMIDVGRVRALGKAARVILDEAVMMGLRGTVDLSAKENVQVTGSRRTYNQEFHGTVTGGEWPPRVFAAGKSRQR